MFALITVWLLLATLSACQKGKDDYLVRDLPGTTGVVKRTMHAGNIGLSLSTDLFFWRFEGDKKDTTILWLNGGPGCSSMDGNLMEIGPYRVGKGGQSLLNNHGAWTKYANLVFVDQPVGVGFSKGGAMSLEHDMNQLTEHLVAFMDKYFAIFPEDKTKFYIAGESYAGQYIPYLATALVKHNLVKIKGLMIGNGFVDLNQDLSLLPFAQEHGLVPPSAMVSLNDEQARCEQSINSCKMSTHLLSVFSRHHGGRCFNIYNVRLQDSYPACGMNWPPDLPNVEAYLHRTEVLKAINTHTNIKWKECSTPVQTSLTPPLPAVDLIDDLTAHMPILFFNGDLDWICNYQGTEKMLNQLTWQNQVGFSSKAKNMAFSGGTIKSDRNVYYARVFNASHMVPYDQPEAAQTLLYSFLHLT